MTPIAKNANDFGSQRFVQNLYYRLTVGSVSFRNCTLLHVLARARAQSLNVGNKWFVRLADNFNWRIPKQSLDLTGPCVVFAAIEQRELNAQMAAARGQTLNWHPQRESDVLQGSRQNFVLSTACVRLKCNVLRTALNRSLETLRRRRIEVITCGQVHLHDDIPGSRSAQTLLRKLHLFEIGRAIAICAGVSCWRLQPLNT